MCENCKNLVDNIRSDFMDKTSILYYIPYNIGIYIVITRGQWFSSYIYVDSHTYFSDLPYILL